jgi:hypothetical protein
VSALDDLKRRARAETRRAREDVARLDVEFGLMEARTPNGHHPRPTGSQPAMGRAERDQLHDDLVRDGYTVSPYLRRVLEDAP